MTDGAQEPITGTKPPSERLYVVFEHSERVLGQPKLDFVASVMAARARAAGASVLGSDEDLRIRRSDGEVIDLAIIPAHHISIQRYGEPPAPGWLQQEALRLVPLADDDR